MILTRASEIWCFVRGGPRRHSYIEKVLRILSPWPVLREDLNWSGECTWSRSYGQFWLLTLWTRQQSGLPIKITLGIVPLHLWLRITKEPLLLLRFVLHFAKESQSQST